MSKETTDMEYPSPQQHVVGGADAELKAENERFREALELIKDIDIRPYRCASIAQTALNPEDRT